MASAFSILQLLDSYSMDRDNLLATEANVRKILCALMISN